MRFSLLQLIVGIAFIGTALGLGVNTYRLSRELQAEQSYAYQLERYTSELREELVNAERREGEIYADYAAQIDALIASGELKLKPSEPLVRHCAPFPIGPEKWGVLKVAVPQRGIRHTRYSHTLE